MSAIEEVESILLYNSMGLTPEEFVSIESLLKQLKAANKVVDESVKYIKMTISSKGAQDDYYKALKECEELK